MPVGSLYYATICMNVYGRFSTVFSADYGTPFVCHKIKNTYKPITVISKRVFSIKHNKGKDGLNVSSGRINRPRNVTKIKFVASVFAVDITPYEFAPRTPLDCKVFNNGDNLK